METRQPAAAPVVRAGGAALGVTAAPFLRSGPAAVLNLARRAERPVADGAVPFWLRPPASSDLSPITAMWERCSLATRIARFHAPVRDIPASYLKAVLSDPSTSLVAVPRHAGGVAALASLVPGGGGSAELGVLVEDAWQCHGIGRHLVAHLIAAAPARQITELTASVLTQNAKVADLLRCIPGEFSLTRHGTAVNVRVRLASTGPAVDASRRLTGAPAPVMFKVPT